MRSFFKSARDWIRTSIPPGAGPPPQDGAFNNIVWHQARLLEFQSTKYLKKRSNMLRLVFVPETGFEPARRFQRHHLKVVRLPISPPGLRGCKCKRLTGHKKNKSLNN